MSERTPTIPKYKRQVKLAGGTEQEGTWARGSKSSLPAGSLATRTKQYYFTHNPQKQGASSLSSCRESPVRGKRDGIV